MPDALVLRMLEHRDVQWDQYLRNAVERKLDEINLLDRLVKVSRLTESDAEEFGHKIKAGQRRRHEEAAQAWR